MKTIYPKPYILQRVLLLSIAALLVGCSTTQTVKSVPIASLVPTLAPTSLPSPVATSLPRPVPSYQVLAPRPATVVPPILLEISPEVTELATSSTLTPTATFLPDPRSAASPTPSEPGVTVSPTATQDAASTTAEPSPTTQALAPAERRYVFPVQVSAGRVTYAEAHHDYPATDMFCAIGSQFVAPTDGMIDFTSAEDLWDASNDDPALRGGVSVAMIGDDGVRYYGSHLSELAQHIEPGIRVTAGQLLGLTGKSGNASSTPPHLHFGISHPTTPDDWQIRRGEVSPFRYLKAWERGEMLVPSLP